MGLIVMPSNAGRVTVSTDPQSTLDNGLTLFSTGAQLELCRERHGDAPSQQWFAVAAVAATPLAYLEIVAVDE